MTVHNFSSQRELGLSSSLTQKCSLRSLCLHPSLGTGKLSCKKNKGCRGACFGKLVIVMFCVFQDDELYDIIVLSLVLNFVGDALKRGDMLRRCRRLLRPGGLVFVVLPRKCLDNSQFCTVARFDQIMRSLGYEKQSYHTSPKLSFFMYKLCGAGECRQFDRKAVRTGSKLNSFSICLR